MITETVFKNLRPGDVVLVDGEWYTVCQEATNHTVEARSADSSARDVTRENISHVRYKYTLNGLPFWGEWEDVLRYRDPDAYWA